MKMRYSSAPQFRDTREANAWQTYSYDARGNVTNKGPLSFSYDAAMQPTALSGSDNGRFVYDGNHKRVKQVINGKRCFDPTFRSRGLLC